MMHARKEVEIGVAGYLRVGGQECGELGIVVAHVFLIGEQGGIVGDNGGEGGAETEHPEELVLGGAEVFIADRGDWDRWAGRLGLRAGHSCGHDEGYEQGAKEADGAHCEIPLREKGLKAVLPV